MPPVNHGQSNEKKENPPLSDRYEIVVITEQVNHKQSGNDDFHAPHEVVFEDEISVEPETEPPIVSSERAMMDYVSIKGIKNRTGVQPTNYFYM